MYSFFSFSVNHTMACAANICAGIMAAMTLTALPCAAQTQGRALATPSVGTQYGPANGINDLAGIDPSESICTTGRPTADNALQFCLYNEGTGLFLSIGGLWGTHASTSNTPHSVWFESTGASGYYYLNNRVDGSGTGTYLGTKNGSDLWMDQGNTSGNPKGMFSFEKADGYTTANKVYRIKVTDAQDKVSYVTMFPGDTERHCNITTTAYSATDADYANQVWKIISKEQYYTLMLANPATMKALVDFSFLMQDADFRVNNTDATAWKLHRISESNSDVYLGDATMRCPFENRGMTDTKRFDGTYNAQHQQNYGKYAYCYSRRLRNFYMCQEIQVHRAGWYVLRCNGFSTQQDIEGESKPLAYLFAAQMDKDKNYYKDGIATSATLNVVTPGEAKAMEAEADGAGIGVAFYNGKYENQVQMCVETGDDGVSPVSETNPATLRLGFYVAPGTTEVGSDEMTAVDNFKLLYAGPRRNPELILDEECTDLRYITLAADQYTNSVLHLNRKFNAHQWNSLILPVDLTLGQMKRTFGDAVKVAHLDRIEGSTVFFVTEEPASDDDVLVKAFEPYIVYPPVVNVTSQSYTVGKFYTSEGTDNSQWLSTSYQPTTNEADALSKTIGYNHYDITMVSLDRDLLKQHMEATMRDGEETWISNTSFSAAAAVGEMTCYGTLAKTFENGAIINGRDDLAGDYCMRDGKLVQVPQDGQYGLKGFRCWFEVKGNTPEAAANLALNIDGIEDSATAITDIHGDSTLFTTRMRGIDGVFSLDGRRVTHGSSPHGLPRGIYICNGRKVVVK